MKDKSSVGVLGIDVGFGDVKVAGDDGMVFKFPSAIAPIQTKIVEFGEGADDEFFFNNKMFHVGEKAKYRAIPTRSFRFLEHYAPLLVYRAVQEAKGEVQHLSVGLPVAYYTKDNCDLLKKTLSKITVNNNTLNFNVTISPQGVGALLDYRYNNKGEVIGETNVDGVVIDIGFNTVDVIAFEKGQAISGDSAMLERQGISVITQELISLVQTETKLSLSDQEAKQVLLDGGIKAYGNVMDLSLAIDNIVETYIDKLLYAIESKWEDRLQRASRLIIAGGGAYYLREHIPAKYESLICSPDEPEFANARGFYKRVKAMLAKK